MSRVSRRRLEALRALAGRPGTEAEGKLARELLEKAETQRSADPESCFADFLRTGSMDDLAAAVGTKTCDCGARYPAFTFCPNTARHTEIDLEKRTRFPRGTRVYYNRWAYTANCPGVVTGPGKDWSWIRVKFDHLKNSRAIPIYSELGWHLSTEPLERGVQRAGLRGGMEKFEAMVERIKEAYSDAPRF
jgi:hypothetical protein